MKYVNLPNTDLNISKISLGAAALGTVVNMDDSFAILDAYCEMGGNFLDTAHVYADWHGGERHMSEKTISKWLRKSTKRDHVVIATKGGHPDVSTPLVPRLERSHIIGDLDESLTCLGLEQIDLYWLHRDDPNRPVGEILEIMNEQVSLGKIRYFACANWQPERIRAAHQYAKMNGLVSFVASQIHWSLAAANPSAFTSDHAIMDTTAETYYSMAGMGVVCFTSQAKGFFTKTAANGLDSLKSDLRRDFENPQTLARLERVQELAGRLKVSISTIVLAYITSQPFTVLPIIGPNSLTQLRDSMTDSDLTLSSEMLQFLLTGKPLN